MAQRPPKRSKPTLRRVGPSRKKTAPPAPNAPTVLTPGAKNARDLELDHNVRAAVAAYGVQDFEKAERILTKVLKYEPTHVAALRERGYVRSRGLQDIEGADADFAAALEVKRDNETLAAAAQHSFYAGRMEEAVARAEEAISLDPAKALPYTLLARIKGVKVEDHTLESLEKSIELEDTPQNDRYVGYNALGRIFEKRRDYDAAFRYFEKSNSFARGSYAEDERSTTVSDVRAKIDAAFIEERRGFGLKDQRPVFVVGAPRSGSTLLEQVLTCHGRVDSVGEFNGLTRVERSISERRGEERLPFWRHAFLSSITKSEAQIAANFYLKEATRLCIKSNPVRIVDKALINFLRIPLILMIFPRATIIHTFRHPLDTCISCYKQDFSAAYYASDQGMLAHFFTTYYEYMEHIAAVFPGRVLHVCHEDFVTGFAEKTPALLKAMGLSWDPACLHPEQNERLVHTQSANSVRSPVNTSSFNAWKNYEQHISPLIEGLGGLDAIETRYEKFRALSI